MTIPEVKGECTVLVIPLNTSTGTSNKIYLFSNRKISGTNVIRFLKYSVSSQTQKLKVRKKRYPRTQLH